MKADVTLQQYTTMRLGGAARYMTTATTPNEVRQVYRVAREQRLPVFVLGGGSNVIVRDEGYDGIVLRNCIKGFDVVSEDEETVTIRLGAGELWDSVVARTVDMGLSGIEAMSAIPGTAGAAPVQNVGAYGQEIADTCVSVEAYDSREDALVTLLAAECEFSYRHSIFRGREAGRYCIVSVTIRLLRRPPSPPFYAALQRYLDAHQATNYTPRMIRNAVIAIRHEKLPDPVHRPNAGSFFKNALVSAEQHRKLLQMFPDVPSYPMPHDTYKIPTGWLIDQAGLRGTLHHGMRVHDKNALVLINESAGSYDDLVLARKEIIDAVQQKFGITIEQEPLEM